MKTLIMLKGLPASGKSTWAKQKATDHGYKRVNKDDLREMIDSSKWSKQNEKLILEARDSLVKLWLREGKHVIVDDTNFSPKHESKLKELAKANGAQFQIKYFDIDLDEAIRRDQLRQKSVGSKVIRSMWEKYILPSLDKYIPNKEKPSAYIFDVDGTLANMKDRSPYDWKKVKQDTPNIPVINTLKALKQVGHKIIIFTGRDGVCSQETKEWLEENNITFDCFNIRPEGNTEKDSIIKKKMLEDIQDKYNILGVFDDRDQVVDMWRSLGLICFQVNYGDF